LGLIVIGVGEKGRWAERERESEFRRELGSLEDGDKGESWQLRSQQAWFNGPYLISWRAKS